MEKTKKEPKVEKPKVDSEYNVSIIVDHDGKIDPFYVSDKDPNYAYRFLRFDKGNLATKTGNLLLQKGGWQICSKEHCLRVGVKEKQLGPDGFYHAGDQVLAFMPKNLFEKKEKHKQRLANEPVDAVQRLLNEGDDSLKGVGHENMRGIQTKKQLGID